MTEQVIDLGSCCNCGASKGVRTIVMLPRKAPISGHGWACLQCGQPADGATLVLCDTCAERPDLDLEKVPEACAGWPASDGRVPMSDLTEPFDHDMSRHPESVAAGYASKPWAEFLADMPLQPSAAKTLARIPVIVDPVVSEAMDALFDDDGDDWNG